MLVSEIMTFVKRSFGDEDGVQIQDSDLIRWINAGQREIVKQNDTLLEKSVVSNLLNGVQEYDVPADLLIFKALKIKSTGMSYYGNVTGLTFPQFNQYMDGWDGNVSMQGDPTIYTIYAGKFILFPIPSVDIPDALKVYYQRKPTDVASGADTPDLPLLYHDVLVKYCLKQAYELDEDSDAAGIKNNEVSADLAVLSSREDWKRQETYPTITVLPDDLW